MPGGARFSVRAHSVRVEVQPRAGGAGLESGRRFSAPVEGDFDRQTLRPGNPAPGW